MVTNRLAPPLNILRLHSNFAHVVFSSPYSIPLRAVQKIRLSFFIGTLLCTYARAHRAYVSQKRLGRCVQICRVGLESLPKCFSQVMNGVHPHVRTPFRISGTAGRTMRLVRLHSPVSLSRKPLSPVP